ncbi:MAG: DNA adenine methylase [Spirochaetaceae bacterium]|nr:DNA adenine methylase [Spirochaetaceae bacterium]
MNRIPDYENPEYLDKQIITYLGNKRTLLRFIEEGVEIVKKKVCRKKLDIFDIFSGSGIVSRFFKKHANRLIANDLEKYSEVINRCYLTNFSQFNKNLFMEIYNSIIFRLENKSLKKGIIAELYAPKDDSIIMPGERVFYTKRNALYLDTARQLIDEVPDEYKNFLLAPLLSEASIHTNTSGVFKGFYKDSKTGLGKFGGDKSNALTRILSDIHIPFPVFSNFECDVEIYRNDSNEIIKHINDIDLAYIDPPYNQHPYGSNYFMLNLLVDYLNPQKISNVSGIPVDWNRSSYNKSRAAITVFKDLLENIKAKYLLISFNSEGFIPMEKMIKLLRSIGKVEILEKQYNTFRGSRNLRNRKIHVKEYLYLVDKK